MFMTIITFLITGIVFVVLQFYIKDIWPYYVPTALVVLAIWLKIIQPAWRSNNLTTTVAKTDPSAAAGYLSIISIIYGIVCLFLANWIAFIICVLVFVLSLTMKFPHPY